MAGPPRWLESSLILLSTVPSSAPLPLSLPPLTDPHLHPPPPLTSQGCPATIVMPVTTPDIKVANVRRLGGTVELVGETYQEAQAHALAVSMSALFERVGSGPG